MTMTWAAFESALGGHRDAPGALNALTTTSMTDVQAMLDAIGAGEAGPLLAESRGADPEDRRTSLAASLDIIDRHLPVADRVTKPSLFGRRRVPTRLGPTSRDMVLSALVASLIDSELGGDPERLRTRAAVAATDLERFLAADVAGRSKKDGNAEMSAARQALLAVFKLLRDDLESRETG